MKLALVAWRTYYFTILPRRVATVVFDQAKTDY